MKKTLRTFTTALGVGALVFAVLALVVPGEAVAGKGGGKGGGGGCPLEGIMCTLEYAPVICDGGVVYSNACFAYVNCATGCEPTGGGGPVPL